MRNEKLEKLEKDLDNVIDNTMSQYWPGKFVEKVEADLRENIRMMLWEYEMQGFLN